MGCDLEHRGKGIGRSFMEKLVSVGKEKGLTGNSLLFSADKQN